MDHASSWSSLEMTIFILNDDTEWNVLANNSQSVEYLSYIVQFIMMTICFEHFLSAFLLFQIQPMISSYILPFFGGTPAVVDGTIVFQVFLTGAPTHRLIRRVSTKKQAGIHITILVSSLALVAILGLLWPSPVTPGEGWKPLSVDTPVLDIFKLLLAAVGLPYFLLSTNSPLMQAWFARSQPGRSPYWLYALSNIGSLLGLLAYPFIIEPNLSLKSQGWVWSGGFLLFALLTGYVA
jgi:hypothetical protein